MMCSTLPDPSDILMLGEPGWSGRRSRHAGPSVPSLEVIKGRDWVTVVEVASTRP